MSESQKSLPPESQRQRWVKYGANVVLSCIVVVVLAAMLTWLAQAHAWRMDTTVGGTQSLRPQSVDFIKDLKQPVQIVALYPKLKSNSGDQDFYQPVADLLNEYATKGKNITTELLDPDTQKDDFDKLVAEVTNKYGGEVKGYKEILNHLADENKQVDQFATDEAVKFRALPLGQIQDQQLQQNLYAAYLTLVLAHHQLQDLKTAVDSDLDQQVPSYKDGVDDTKTTYTNISQLFQQFSAVLGSLKDNKTVAKAVQDYAPDAATRADAAKKIVDTVLDKISHLGALKELDEFRTQLKSKSIIVMTDAGYKILSFDQVWKVPESSRFASESPDIQPKLSFAGEQQITAAIASLTGGPKPMVVFVRPGGPPLATMSMQGQTPMFAAVAQRLKDDNFDVQEKDASGQAAMQQEEMPMPEPTAEQMKSAIWVVVRPPWEQPSEQPLPLDQMLEEHLKSGGSAMVLLFPMKDPMDAALEPMGIRARADFVIVHEALPPPQRRSNDLVEAALQANQFVFKLNYYGDHPIAKPLNGLDFLTAGSEPIMATAEIPAGVKVTPLLPIPMTPHFWASADTQSILSGDQPKVVTFHPTADPDAGRLYPDIDNTPSDPLYGAAASENKNGARLVVVGSSLFASSDLVDLPDNDMLEKHGLTVARLPGNGEFFVNSILWLAHEDSMLAISPHALQMARIEEMSPAALAFWRVGIMTIGLPLAVIFAGLMVYANRRD
ncbi:MAG TPA: Gldg family protein [Tepidisphaeraceae bacterium]|nr:Gldg family protein [Tepidisphaeraceae bacterium]